MAVTPLLSRELERGLLRGSKEQPSNDPDSIEQAQKAADKLKNCRIPAQRAALADRHAPSIWLPFGFILTGIVSLVLAVALLSLRPQLLASYHYNQQVIAVTHLVVLGWVCSVIMGATYQLVPVALETKLYSERLAVLHLCAHVLAVPGMVWMFWIWDMKQASHFGSIFAVGVCIYIGNVLRTVVRARRWNPVAAGIVSALAWLGFTVLAGLYLASAKCWPQINVFAPIAQMHAHVTAGLIGFFGIMMVSVAYKLVPMFLLGELQNPRRAWASLLLLNLGTGVSAATILLESKLKPLGAALLIAGCCVFVRELRAIFQQRKRKNVDWALISFFTAIGLLIPVSVLGALLSWPWLGLNEFTGQLETAYGFLFVFGVITTAILGMFYKIVPFLVWYASYSREVGRSKVPVLADFYSPAIQAAGYWAYLSGLVMALAGILSSHGSTVRAGMLIVGSGLGLFLVNLIRILTHLISPRIQPLPVAIPARTKLSLST